MLQSAVLIVGLDLAWGERNPDGVCLLEATASHAKVRASELPAHDVGLLEWFDREVPCDADAIVMVDAPIVCPNLTGARPVDREMHRVFGRYHAGCHSANLTKCPRPVRVAARLVERSFAIGWNLETARRLVAEVYPHPAMVRFFGLDRILKYKRSPVANKRLEFRRYQRLLGECISARFPQLERGELVSELLHSEWSKAVEDRLDAFFCALIGYHHWLYHGQRSEVFGDKATGFILVPAADDENKSRRACATPAG